MDRFVVLVGRAVSVRSRAIWHRRVTAATKVAGFTWSVSIRSRAIWHRRPRASRSVSTVRPRFNPFSRHLALARGARFFTPSPIARSNSFSRHLASVHARMPASTSAGQPIRFNPVLLFRTVVLPHLRIPERPLSFNPVSLFPAVVPALRSPPSRSTARPFQSSIAFPDGGPRQQGRAAAVERDGMFQSSIAFPGGVPADRIRPRCRQPTFQSSIAFPDGVPHSPCLAAPRATQFQSGIAFPDGVPRASASGSSLGLGFNPVSLFPTVFPGGGALVCDRRGDVSIQYRFSRRCSQRAARGCLPAATCFNPVSLFPTVFRTACRRRTSACLRFVSIQYRFSRRCSAREHNAEEIRAAVFRSSIAFPDGVPAVGRGAVVAARSFQSSIAFPDGVPRPLALVARTGFSRFNPISLFPTVFLPFPWLTSAWSHPVSIQYRFSRRCSLRERLMKRGKASSVSIQYRFSRRCSAKDLRRIADELEQFQSSIAFPDGVPPFSSRHPSRFKSFDPVSLFPTVFRGVVNLLSGCPLPGSFRALVRFRGSLVPEVAAARDGFARFRRCLQGVRGLRALPWVSVPPERSRCCGLYVRSSKVTPSGMSESLTVTK